MLSRIIFALYLACAVQARCRRARGKSVDEPCPHDLKLEGATTEPTMAPSTLNFLAPPKCLAGQTVMSDAGTMWDIYQSVKQDFQNTIFGYTPLDFVTLIGMSVRLPFHDAGEAFVTNETYPLGPDGCLSMAGDNSGLVELDEQPNTLLEPLWQKYCTQISRADFWALWGKIAVEYSAQPGTIDVEFHWGRVDNPDCLAGIGRLPESTITGIDYTSQLFVTQMGLTLKEGVVLLGGHSVGRVFPANSGFGFNPNQNLFTTNAWDTTPSVLDNVYYQRLVQIDWEVDPEQDQPFHAQDYVSTDGTETIMLNADMNIGFLYYNQTICPPQAPVNDPPGAFTVNEDCQGLFDVCGGDDNTCSRGNEDVMALVDDLAEDNQLFLDLYSAAWTKMTNINYAYPGMPAGWNTSLGTLEGPLVEPVASSSSGLSQGAAVGISVLVIFLVAVLVVFLYGSSYVKEVFGCGTKEGDKALASQESTSASV